MHEGGLGTDGIEEGHHKPANKEGDEGRRDRAHVEALEAVDVGRDPRKEVAGVSIPEGHGGQGNQLFEEPGA